MIRSMYGSNHRIYWPNEMPRGVAKRHASSEEEILNLQLWLGQLATSAVAQL